MSGFLAPLKQRFTRVTSSVAYIPQLDGLRSLALLLVLGHHVSAIYLQGTHRLGTQHLPEDWGLIAPRSAYVNWALHMAFGVPIFFAISGFVLALPFARAMLDKAHMPSVPLYFLRRIIRLEPPYFLSLTLMFWLLVAPWRNNAHDIWVMKHVFQPHYVASLAYVHALVYAQPSWISGIAWTLEIEIQFYLLMPVIALLFRWKNTSLRRITLAGLTVLAALFGQYVVPGLHAPRIEYSLAGHLEFFLAGVLLADIALHPPEWLQLRAVATDALAAASGALVVYVLHWQPRFHWLEPLLVVTFYYGVFGDGWAGRVFRAPWLTIPGTMCYTIYLYHYLVAERWMRVTLRLASPVRGLPFEIAIQMLLVLPVLLLVAAVLYLAAERPFVLLSHWATRRWRPAAHPAEAVVHPAEATA